MNTRAKILLAEDEPVTREFVKVILERAGYEVIVVGDGEAAVAMAASEKPDVVIIDGLLPKLHGFLVCKAIKALDPAPKVIITTAIYTKLTYKWEVKRNYLADDLLIKPVSRADLLECVRKHLGAAGSFNEAESEVLNREDANSASREAGEGIVINGAETKGPFAHPIA